MYDSLCESPKEEQYILPYIRKHDILILCTANNHPLPVADLGGGLVKLTYSSFGFVPIIIFSLAPALDNSPNS